MLAHGKIDINGESYAIGEKIYTPKYRWTPTMMVRANFWEDLLELNRAARKVVIYLEKILTDTSPFLEITQKKLAEQLQVTEVSVFTGMKQLTTIVPPVLFKIKPGVWMVNPEVLWKMSFPQREKWVLYINRYGMQKAYELSRHRGFLATLDSILKEDKCEYKK